MKGLTTSLSLGLLLMASGVSGVDRLREYRLGVISATPQLGEPLSSESEPPHALLFIDSGTLNDSLAARPELEDALRSYASRGKVSTGGFYRMAAASVLGGESFIRNMLLGRAAERRWLGQESRAAVFDDARGLPTQSPQLLLAGGFDALLSVSPTPRGAHWRLAPSGHALWQGYLSDLETSEGAHIAPQTVELNQWTAPSDSGPDEAIPAHQEAIQRLFERVKRGEAVYPLNGFPSLKETSLTIELSRAWEMENALLETERWAAIADIETGGELSGSVSDYWREFLDIADRLAGSHKAAYLVNRPSDFFGDLRQRIETLRKEALGQLAARIDTGGELHSKAKAALIVWNPSSFARTDLVRAVLPTGHRIATATGPGVLQETALPSPGETADATGQKRVDFLAEDVPAMGYRLYAVEEGTPPAPERRFLDAPERLRTYSFFIDVAPARGGIVRLIERDSERNVLDASGQGVALAVTPETGQFEQPFEKHAAVCHLYEGPLSIQLDVLPVTDTRLGYRLRIPKHVPRLELSSLEDRPVIRLCLAAPGLAGNSLIVCEPFGITVSGSERSGLTRWGDLSYVCTVGHDGGGALSVESVEIVSPAKVAGVAAHRLIQAFLRRGVPSQLITEEAPIPNGSITLGAIRLVIGTDTSGTEAKRLVEGLPGSVFHYLQAEIAAHGWGLVFTVDKDRPTVVLMAQSGRLAEAVRELERELDSQAALRRPTRAGNLKTASNDSEGTRCGITEAGLMVSSPAGVVFQRNGDTLEVLTAGAVGCFLQPHAKDWQTAGTVASAQAASMPLTATALPLQEGDSPALRSWLTLRAEEAMLSSLHWDGESLLARIWEPHGRTLQSEFEWSGALRRVGLEDLSGASRKRVVVRKRRDRQRIPLTLSPFDIQTFRLEPRHVGK